MAKVDKFEDLLIWQKGLSQAIDLYKLMVACTDFGLRDQMRRSAVSVPSNVAEGFERHTNKEFIRYLRIAKGSNGELRTQIHVAIGVGIIETTTGEELLAKSRILSSMLQNLVKTREEKFS